MINKSIAIPNYIIQKRHSKEAFFANREREDYILYTSFLVMQNCHSETEGWDEKKCGPEQALRAEAYFFS